MSLPRRIPARAVAAPLLVLLCSGACATLLDPRPPLLRIRTDSVAATVRDADGRTLGTTPFRGRLRARRQQTLVITAPGYDSAVVTVGWQVKNALPTLLNPLSWPVDAATGAYWVHAPDSVDIILSPSRHAVPAGPAPDAVVTVSGGVPGVSAATPVDVPPFSVPLPGVPSVNTPTLPGEGASDRKDAVSDPVAAVVLAEFADAAEAAGCEPLLVGAWRDAARVLAESGPGAPADSVRAAAAAEVLRAVPEIREICARPSPRLEQLRAIRESVEAPANASPGSPPVLAPVYFGAGEWEVRDDSVRARLLSLGARLSNAPVTLVVEGFADAGELRHPELGYQRAQSVIRLLRSAGLPADCCIAISHSGEPLAGAPDPRLNRRATLTLDYRRTP